MFIQQLYTGCLSEAAYYIESDGEAAIIDPLRDIDPYLQLARDRKARIKYIFETHFHADFVSGHLDLSQATGAPIVYGPGTVTRFPVHVAKDGEEFSIGQLRIKVLHTPGHTPGSACYRVGDQVLTGDTLFVFGCGRCDLRGGNPEQMFQSLRRLSKRLPSDTIVRPGHNYGITPTSTMLEQIAGNPFLHFDHSPEFVEYRMHLHDREEPYRPEQRPHQHPH